MVALPDLQGLWFLATDQMLAPESGNAPDRRVLSDHLAEEVAAAATAHIAGAMAGKWSVPLSWQALLVPIPGTAACPAGLMLLQWKLQRRLLRPACLPVQLPYYLLVQTQRPLLLPVAAGDDDVRAGLLRSDTGMG